MSEPQGIAMHTHTPTPWRVYPKGHCVPGYDVCPRIVSDKWSDRCEHEGLSDEDAAHIVRCVNSHDALVSALEAVLFEADQPQHPDDEPSTDWDRAIRQAREALRLARPDETKEKG